MIPKVFVSTGGIRELNGFDACNDLAELGIDSFELSGGKFFNDVLNKLKYLEDQNFNIQIHNYFPVPQKPFVLNLASSDDLISKLSIEHCIKSIELASKLKLKRYSFHAGFCMDPSTKELGKPFNKKKLIMDRNSFLERFIKRVKILKSFADSKEVDLYVENNVSIKENIFDGEPLLLGSDYNEVKNIKDQTGVKILIDTGHLIVSANSLGNNEEEELEKLKGLANAYHLSSNNRLRDQNKPIKYDKKICKFISKYADFYTVEVYSKKDIINEDYKFISDFLKQI